MRRNTSGAPVPRRPAEHRERGSGSDHAGRFARHLHGEGQEDFTDGCSLETPEWRFNIRGSNTEPLLRLNIEARKEPLVNQIKKQIEKIIGGSPE